MLSSCMLSGFQQYVLISTTRNNDVRSFQPLFLLQGYMFYSLFAFIYATWCSFQYQMMLLFIGVGIAYHHGALIITTVLMGIVFLCPQFYVQCFGDDLCGLFYFGYCIVCPLNYGFLLLQWYLLNTNLEAKRGQLAVSYIVFNKLSIDHIYK